MTSVANAAAVPNQLVQITHLSCGIIRIRSCSIFLASVFFVKSSRVESRVTCVSTTTPEAIPNAVPSTNSPSCARHPVA